MRTGMRYMLVACFLFISCSVFSPPTHSAEAQTGSVLYHIALDGDIINPPSAEYIIDAIKKAEEDGAAALILELDTPGGLLTSTRTIVKRMMNASVPIVTYVAPKGSRAGSAGVFITLAANIAAMAPSTNIGAAHPVHVGQEKQSSNPFGEFFKRLTREGEKETPEEDARKTAQKPSDADATEGSDLPLDQKILNDTIAWAETIAKARGRNVEWAKRAVVESISTTEDEALTLGVIDLIAEDVPDLINKLDGRIISISGKKRTFETAGATIVDISKNLRIRLLTALAHPNIAYILMMLGFYGLLFEFTNPGFGFPGTAGAICIVLAFFGLEVLPTNYAGIALIAIAIAMFIAEVKVVSYGFLTIGGLLSMFIGSMILFKSPHSFMRVSLPLILVFTLGTLAIAIFLIVLAARSQRKKAVTGLEGMVGARGKVLKWSDTSGRVFVHGEIWEAEGSEHLQKDEAVEVIATRGMTLLVKKISHL